MKTRKIELHEQQLLVDLFLSDKNNQNTDYYIDRKKDFWAPYSWYSKNDHFAFGVFDGKELVAMAAMARLPMSYQNQFPLYLCTDFFVRQDYRKTYATAKLLRTLESYYPDKPIYVLGVENQPLFLDVLEKFSVKFGKQVKWLKPTLLSQYFLISCPQSAESLTTSNKKEDILYYWEAYKAEWSREKDLYYDQDFDISCFPGIQYASYSKGNQVFECLLVDKTSVQEIRWNGTPRIQIERYRRSLSMEGKSFEKEGCLRNLNVCFPKSSSLDIPYLENVQLAITRYAFLQNYFSWTVRDFDFQIKEKNPFYEKIDFERRILSIDNIPDEARTPLIDKLSTQSRMLESIFI